MNLFDTIFGLIDLRSFSNLWYWIALAAVWFSASYWGLGIPFGMVRRARRRGGQAAQDLQDYARLNVRRLMTLAREAGLGLAIAIPFGLTVLALTGFLYGAEISQAVFLIVLPLTLVLILSLRVAARLEPRLEAGMPPEALIAALSRHRIAIQVIGMAAILVTWLWGMFQNLRFSILG